MPPTPVNKIIQDEIQRLVEIHKVGADVLDDFAKFVISNHKKKDPVIKPIKIKPLTLPQLKAAVYHYFEVADTPSLKQSGSFKMATSGMDKLNLSVKAGWEILYRKFVGILPGEEHQTGAGCINGINIFNYFKPWQVFGLDPKTATESDIKAAYHNLSKVYHPDSETGDAEIFNRINALYQSISAKA